MRVALFSKSPILMAAVVALFATAAVPPASAHDPQNPRHQAMELLSDNMKALGRMMRSGLDAEEAMPLATAVVDVAERMPALFETRNPGHNNNRAKPEIWDDWSGFSAQIDRFRGAAESLVVAVDSGDQNAFGAAMSNVGQSCTACHRPYRAPQR